MDEASKKGKKQKVKDTNR